MVMFVKKFLLVGLSLLAFAIMPGLAIAQQKLVEDPEIYEKQHFLSTCKPAEFGDGFIRRLDINNDGLEDVIVNHGELTCDGVRGAACTAEGCPYDFFIQVKEGGYLMIATAKLYGYDFVQRFGNMVFVFKMHPRYCDRTDATPCEMTVRVRGGRFFTISKK